MPTKQRKPVDWERIEAQYRAGVMSLREIAGKHGITEGAIRKKAKEFGWERDLAARVEAKAKSLVRKETVRKELVRKDPVRSDAYPETEAEVVEVEAQVQARIQISHRKDIGLGRSVVGKLLGELEHQTDNQDLYEQLAELVIPAEENESTEASARRAQKMREAFHKAMSLGSRAGTVKSLAESMRVLIGLEREAFGIGGSTGDGSHEDFLKSLGQ